eukprot:gnl/Carplike_NY0171/12964_a18828_108.p1 GENE.gnl/Carplike_NY0171/12964_a18828_108~~gnl/Carplike_NY0171/12964_a18828_108.p1  ORF type:complete len:204 (+),score=40.70 gnl/Carplike_NY0171/12964_a18828_108:3-614(+)
MEPWMKQQSDFSLDIYNDAEEGEKVMQKQREGTLITELMTPNYEIDDDFLKSFDIGLSWNEFAFCCRLIPGSFSGSKAQHTQQSQLWRTARRGTALAHAGESVKLVYEHVKSLCMHGMPIALENGVYCPIIADSASIFIPPERVAVATEHVRHVGRKQAGILNSARFLEGIKRKEEMFYYEPVCIRIISIIRQYINSGGVFEM